jgi:hypothetical protein
MVAVIKTGSSIHSILNYNENKVKQGVAECIGQGNYLAEANNMSFTMKLNRMLKLTALNDRVKRNNLHISLNFDVSEKDLPREKLLEIADTYMDKIGFGKQPYLVYQHHDAGHPHLHITTVNIQSNGKRIGLHNIGIEKSEPARKEIEETFGLVKAESQKKKEYKPEAIAATKAQYGKTETKKAIQNVLNTVIDRYRFTSLPELNAVLNQYNVLADRGSENSRTLKHEGLLYHILDESGKPVGVPIKASLFYSKPTLTNLEAKYNKNEALRMPHKARVKGAIDSALTGGRTSIDGMIKELEQKGIKTILRRNADSVLYGVTYVDHSAKCVFNGSALGKQYSAKAIQERCGITPDYNTKTNVQQSKLPTAEFLIDKIRQSKDIPSMNKILDQLIEVIRTNDYVPIEYKKKKRKKRKNL